MKMLAKKIVMSILAWQVKRLRSKNSIKVIGIFGSIGKTSTKLAIAQVLKTSNKVIYQEGNYNDPISVPLIFFGQSMPSLMNPLAWFMIFIKNEKQLFSKYLYDIAVVELGADGIGQMEQFGKYLHLDIGVLTSIAPEHMEYFKTLDVVASEELQPVKYSNLLVYNQDLCDPKYLKDIKINSEKYSINDAGKLLKNIISDAHKYSATAAIKVAEKVGMSTDQIAEGLKNIQPMAGRMQILRGINDSIILDDSYNSSPVAVKQSLKALYEYSGSKKIALLGNMNELGEYSEKAHVEIADYCDPTKLDLVITLGPEVNEFTAPLLKKKGIMVEIVDDPYSAGKIIENFVEQNSDCVVLIKGSQNRVYAEEAIKSLLKDPSDQKLLVRQSSYWMKQKSSQFHNA